MPRSERDVTEEEEEEKRLSGEAFVVVPPNGGWGWMVVVCAFYCNVVLDGVQLTFGVFLNSISQDLGVENSKVALAGSLMFGIHLLMGPVSAGFTYVFGLRPVTIIGSLIGCFGVGMSYFSTGYWYLYFSYGIVGGVGLGLIYMNTLGITSSYFTSLLPVALAIVVCGTGVGTMVFAGLGSSLLKVMTWRCSFLIEAALVGSIGIAALTFKPLKPVKVKVLEVPAAGTAPESVASDVSIRRQPYRGSIFIKTEMPKKSSIFSSLSIQNQVLSLTSTQIIRTRQKRECKWSKCCKRRKSPFEREEVLVLQEIKSGDPYTERRSYVEKVDLRDREGSTQEGSAFTVKSVYTKFDLPVEKSKKKFWKSIKRSIIVMLDCRLLAFFSFFLFTLSGAINLAACLIVFIYEKDRCDSMGYSPEMSVNFIIALGAVNLFWRLFLGVIALIPKVHYGALSISGTFLGGVATMVSGLNSSIYFHFGFCFLFGLSMACLAVFRVPLLISMVGKDFFENAAGINLLFMGVFSIAFPPLFGVIEEAAKSYNVIFIVTGTCIVLSGLMMINLKTIDTSKISKIRRISDS